MLGIQHDEDVIGAVTRGRPHSIERGATMPLLCNQHGPTAGGTNGRCHSRGFAGGELSTLLESYGAKVFVCPTIEIREPESYERLDEALDHLYGYDWLIFTSANGVEFFMKRLTRRAD